MGGSLENTEIESLQTRYPELKKLKIFIEGGTYQGVSSRLASKYFDTVYTFEINQDLFISSLQTTLDENIDNINHYLGDSVILLKNTLIKDKREAFFFLDAHQSGHETSNNGINVPVMDELKVINETYPKDKLALICVDDYRLWAAKVWDWAHVTNEKIIGMLNNHKVTHSFVENDRFFIIINN